jgi:protein-disulfide isomerase
MFKKTLLLAFLALALAACQPAPSESPKAVEAEQIRALLKENPKLVFEALAQDKLALYQLVVDGEKIKRRQLWEQGISRGLANPLKPDLDPSRPWHGSPQAPLVIVEYSDFMCPSCATGAENLAKLFAKHPGKFRVLLKHNPHGTLAKRLALYFEAIGRQDPAKAWEFYRQVFKQQKKIQKEKLAAVQKILQGMDLDQGRLARDMADPALARRLKRDTAEADKFKLHGTPSFVVAGVAVRGPASVSGFEDIMRQWQARPKRALDAKPAKVE